MINDKQFLKKTEDEIKKYNTLNKVFSKVKEGEQSEYEKKRKALDLFKDIGENDNMQLADIYMEFSTKMKEVEDYRKQEIDKISNVILPATLYYPSKAKQHKQRIGNYTDIKKQKEKQQAERSKAQSNSENERAKQIQQDISRKEELINQNGQSLEKDILEFEADRITNNKYLFLHFIHSEIAFHAAALEKLTALYKSLQEKDPIEGLPQFVTKYNLSSVGDLGQFGYDKRKIENRKKRKNDNFEQRSQISSVQGGNMAMSGNLGMSGNVGASVNPGIGGSMAPGNFSKNPSQVQRKKEFDDDEVVSNYQI